MNNIEKLKSLQESNDLLIRDISNRIINKFNVDIYGSDSLNPIPDLWSVEDITVETVRRALGSKKLDEYISTFKSIPDSATKRVCIDWSRGVWKNVKYKEWWLTDLSERINKKHFNKKIRDLDAIHDFNEIHVCLDEFGAVKTELLGSIYVGSEGRSFNLYEYTGFLLGLLYSHPHIKIWANRIKQENYLYFLVNTQKVEF